MKASPNLRLDLIDTSRILAERGWARGTSGNFSVVLNKNPLKLGITASGVDKSKLSLKQILEINAQALIIGSSLLQPSAESLAHIAIVQATDAGAVLHVHSVWNTILSELHGANGGFTIEGYEMLKGLENITSHTHREWIPILENTQDMPILAQQIKNVLQQHPKIHGCLIRRHGLYTWGENLFQAQRHIEIFEFLFQTIGELLSIPRERLSTMASK